MHNLDYSVNSAVVVPDVVHASPLKDITGARGKNGAVVHSFTSFLQNGSNRRLREELASLQTCRKYLISIVLVGSVACGMEATGSDLDLVLIVRDKYFENVCNHVFDRELEISNNDPDFIKAEYTVLTPSQVEDLFRQGAPFAYAIRHGKVLFDTGYFRNLGGKRMNSPPSREYCLASLFENIATPYFNIIKTAEANAAANNCCKACCSKIPHCDNMLSVGILPQLIFRMLYLTLPNNGVVPLSKKQAADLAEIFYGQDISMIVRKAAVMVRSQKKTVAYSEYRNLKKVAIKLFREILTQLTLESDVRQILKDAACAVRGRFDQINNPVLRNCLI